MRDKRKKILFLEQRTYYESLGILNNINPNQYIIEFDGNKRYKMLDEQMKEYSYVISTLYHDELSNFMTIKAIENKVITILLGDGIIEWANMFENPFIKKKGYNLYHPILQEHFLCLGLMEKKYFDFLGVEAHQFLPERVIAQKKKVPMKTKGKILLTTANTAYFNEKEYISLINLMKKIIEELEDQQQIIYFRIYDENLVSELNIPQERNLIKGGFEEVLEGFDIVISTPSSIVLNSMYHDRAVAQMIYRDSPVFLQSGWMITNNGSIVDTIDSMIKRDLNRMNFQDFVVNQYVNLESENIRLDFNNNSKKKQMIDKTLYNLLNSKANFNILYSIRNFYLKYKNNKIMKKISSEIKKR